MGLDMYLEGELYQWGRNGRRTMETTGKPIKCIRVELGYWRKHHELHRHIVNKFAEGVDNCQEIELSAEDVLSIIDVLETEPLAIPDDSVRLYVDAEGRDRADTIKTFKAALKWNDGEDRQDWSRSLVYRASW
jgi:hypothetical protein